MTKDYSFFLGRIHFTSDNGSQSVFASQAILDKLELTKTEVLIMLLFGNWKECLFLNAIIYCSLAYHKTFWI